MVTEFPQELAWVLLKLRPAPFLQDQDVISFQPDEGQPIVRGRNSGADGLTGDVSFSSRDLALFSSAIRPKRPYIASHPVTGRRVEIVLNDAPYERGRHIAASGEMTITVELEFAVRASQVTV